MIALLLVPPFTALLKSLLIPTRGSANTKLLALLSVLTPTLATLPPPSVFRIGSAPVAFSRVLEPPKFTGVQLFPLPDWSCPIGAEPSKGR